METEIVSLLLGVASGITKDVAVASLRAFFAQEADFVQRLIRATCGRFPEVEGAEPALRKWTSRDSFIDLLERVHAGERDFDDEIVASFICDGDFYLPNEEERTALAAKIVAAFLSEFFGALYRSDEGLPAFANRQEVLHIETRDEITQHVDAKFAGLTAVLQSVLADAVAQPGFAESGMFLDPDHRELAEKIDFARGLIHRGLVNSARLEIWPESGLSVVNGYTWGHQG